MQLSMTGYAREINTIDGFEITVEIRSVNSRFFDFNYKGTKAYGFLEDFVRRTISKKVTRGRIEVFLYIEAQQGEPSDLKINKQLLSNYLKSFNEISDEFNLVNDISMTALTRLQDVFSVKRVQPDEDILLNAVNIILGAAILKFNDMRANEGERLCSNISSNLEELSIVSKKIYEKMQNASFTYLEKLKLRLAQLLDGVQIDENRLVAEATIYADKVDVNEEIVRIESHIIEFKKLLNCNIAVGKKLDFLTQELNREANTTGSKCNDVEVTFLVVEAKSLIERIREQVQNIE